jgi:hypothetical protein
LKLQNSLRHRCLLRCVGEFQSKQSRNFEWPRYGGGASGQPRHSRNVNLFLPLVSITKEVIMGLVQQIRLSPRYVVGFLHIVSGVRVTK